jgi:hypothetical protein
MSITLPSFPNPVDEVSARLVAGGVLLLATSFVLTGWTPLVAVLAYGFLARVLAGPRLSPLGLLVTRGLRPRLPLAPRPVPGPPKRFAQGMGAAMTTAALVLWLVGATTAVDLLLAALIVASGLEAIFALCLGCQVFALLMRAGVVPDEICEECNNIWTRTSQPA